MFRKPQLLSWNDPKVINHGLSLIPGKGFWSYKQGKQFAVTVISTSDLLNETILWQNHFMTQIIVKMVNGYPNFYVLCFQTGWELEVGVVQGMLQSQVH